MLEVVCCDARLGKKLLTRQPVLPLGFGNALDRLDQVFSRDLAHIILGPTSLVARPAYFRYLRDRPTAVSGY